METGGVVDKLSEEETERPQSSEKESQDELLPKRGGSSLVWGYFGFKATDSDQKTAICKVCKKSVPSPDANTTNLFYHLKKHHEKEYDETQKARVPTIKASGSKPIQPKIQDALVRNKPYEKTSRIYQQITDAIARLIAKGMVPVYLVEKKAFKDLITTLDPRYIMPSRKYFTRVELPRLYEETRAKVEKEIREMCFYALTTDLWTSRVTQPYMSLTIHFIDRDWNLCSRCLQTTYFPEDHTGAAIAQALSDALESWGLEETNLVSITTDNAANNITAAQINDWLRLQCFGHRLQLAIEAALRALPQAQKNAVERAVGVCKKVVSAFSNSPKKRRDLHKAQEALGLPFHELITESPTRWGSRASMIERFLEQESALSQVLRADKKKRHLVPSWQDISLLESINKALAPLMEFTDALSGETYVSISFLKPVIHLFNTEVLKRQDDPELTEAIREGILQYLKEKYDDPTTDDLLDIATLVDPRFKTAYIRDEERVELVKARAATEMEDMVRSEHAPTAAAPSPPPAAAVAALKEEDDPQPLLPARKVRKSLASYFKKTPAPGHGTAPSRMQIEMELNMYLQAPGPDSEADPLEWWKLHGMTLPRVAKLAKKYLCIPATSASSERAFSASGNIVTCKRSCLKPNRVDMLTFLALNL